MVPRKRRSTSLSRIDVVTHVTFKNQHRQPRVMSDDEDDFEELAEQIDSPKFTALSLSVADALNFPNPGQQLADELAAITEPFDQLQKARTAAIINPLDEMEKARRDAIIEPFNQLQKEHILGVSGPLEEFRQTRLDAIINPLDGFQQARLDAIIDLPDEVFSTALTASAVSSRARTNTSPTPSRSSSEPVEAPANPTTTDVDVEAPKFLYLNTAYTLARYIAYRIDGLSQQQREDAATVIAAGIVGYAAHHYPQVSESPLVASTSILSAAMFLQHVRSNQQQD